MLAKILDDQVPNHFKGRWGRLFQLLGRVVLGISGWQIIAYTVWSRKKGAGQKIMEEALSFAKSNGYKRIVTLSPLTPMATHYHIRNGAKLLGLNPTTQNFEYSL